MKQRLLILVLLVISSCGTAPQPTTESTALGRPLLYIFINDVSQSNPWLQLPRKEMLDLVLQDSVSRPAIQLAGILIQENSSAQTPYLSQVLKPKIQICGGNVFERSAISQTNDILMKEYHHLGSLTVDSLLSHLEKPRKLLKSDINGAVTLAITLASQPGYQDFDIRVVILSDLIQDTHENDVLNAFEFPPQTRLYLIGTSSTVTPEKVFPRNDIVKLTVFKAQFFLN
jgi:hypothetical protein